jgi:hypothetical protein
MLPAHFIDSLPTNDSSFSVMPFWALSFVNYFTNSSPTSSKAT